VEKIKMVSMHDEKILVLDFGSQTTQLIARRVREASVYCEIYPYTVSLSKIKDFAPKGIIFSGSPANVYAKNAPTVDPGLLSLGIPILGICYGMQIIAHLLGGVVAKSECCEYGFTKLRVIQPIGPLCKLNTCKFYQVWMSHGDCVKKMPDGFMLLASSENSLIAAIGDLDRRLYGVEFHPEVVHSIIGADILTTFVYSECGCRPIWSMHNFIEATIAKLRTDLAGEKVICAFSGGVDSSVVLLLLHYAIKDNLIGVFVDNGLLRTGEVNEVARVFYDTFNIKLRIINASQKFLGRLKGIIDPEQKRRIIGYTFIEVLETEAEFIDQVDFLAQGTLYPDVIESVSFNNLNVVIKTHHNVGGLPKKMRFNLIEPLRELFKDECRKIAHELGLPKIVINRQPFPGPGLAIRIIGEVTKQRLYILRKADIIIREEMEAINFYHKVWQSFAILIPIKTVGVMGDERVYKDIIALRIVNSIDAMTANWSYVPYNLLASISNRIVNEIYGISRVVLDITNKPPATIEWE